MIGNGRTDSESNHLAYLDYVEKDTTNQNSKGQGIR